MTTTGDGGGPEPLDPDFAALFRPEDVAPAAVPPTEPEPEAMLEPTTDEPPAAEHAPAEAAPEPSVAPMPIAESSVDTGRLFRSQGVSGHQEAVLALASDHGGRLRTLERRTDDAAPAVPAVPLAPITDAPPTTDDAGPLLAHEPSAGEAAMPAAGEPGSRRRRLGRRGTGGRGITAGAVYLVIFGVTLLVGFADVLLTDDIGWLTGLALVASTVYCALTVRREDDTVAFITPPVAFLLVALTAAQLSMGSVEGTLLNRGVVVFFTLADNWPWIIGATVAALVIVLVRRRRT